MTVMALQKVRVDTKKYIYNSDDPSTIDIDFNSPVLKSHFGQKIETERPRPSLPLIVFRKSFSPWAQSSSN